MGLGKQKIIFRVDGNSDIGLGHIYRGIALAEMLKEDFDILFVTKPSTTFTPISEANFQYQYLSENTAIASLNQHLTPKYKTDQKLIDILNEVTKIK